MSAPNPSSRDLFLTTRWTVVVAAGQSSAPQAEQALEELCRSYWYPLYAYVRRSGYSKEAAEDLTQGFFARFLRKNYLSDLSAEKGRFRGFLLASLKHYLANERDHGRALKRGGGAVHFPLDWNEADARYQIADAAAVSPDRAYDRAWAIALLGKVIGRLRDECIAEGQGGRFDCLKIYLTVDSGDVPHSEVAAALGMNEGSVRVAVHRLRKRYRELLRTEVAQTLADPALVDGEMEALLSVFS
jgi:RNA polymerase sigma-70 factor (ECF subfamily)